MLRALAAVTTASGAAALCFESLWFRQAALAFGSDAWATSLVLASFMAGLGLGNALAAGRVAALASPLRCYAWIELAIAGSGIAAVLGLPALGHRLAPLWSALLAHEALLQGLRFALAFGALLVPATAMGATLPLLVQALRVRDASVGSALGRLYGWNTFGAVAGALAGEAFLLERLGVRGTALAAGAANLAAAAGAWALAQCDVADAASHASAHAGARSNRGSARNREAMRLLAATFVAGAVMLALEGVWLRLLALFLESNALAFALVLAVVLAGIATGGYAAGVAARRTRASEAYAAELALVAGTVTAASAAMFPLAAAPVAQGTANPVAIAGLTAFLAFPSAVASGALFPLIGARLAAQLEPAGRATGWLTLANTAGSALGGLCGPLLLIPWLGIDDSLRLLAGLYAAVVLAIGFSRVDRSLPRFAALALLFGAALALLPRDALRRIYAPMIESRFAAFGAGSLEELREGRTETAMLLRSERAGEIESWRLVTNGFGMASTRVPARRYMKLFAWLPAAFHPAPERALLISYGIGNSARALADIPELEALDVVDISRDVLAFADRVHGAENPLADPRVRVHVEDGRFFLLARGAAYDLITAEPPPPKHAGAGSLYTRECYAAIREHLAEGGIASWWLPVHQLYWDETRSILRAFCEVFPDCTLWTGADLNWMMVGSRNATWQPSQAHFTRLWRRPELAAELAAIGLETPASLAPLFLADSEQIAAWTDGAPAFVDGDPRRIANALDPARMDAEHRPPMEIRARRANFGASAFARRAWPPGLTREAGAAFAGAALLEASWGVTGAPQTALARLEATDRLLLETELETPVLWWWGLDHDALRALRAARSGGRRHPEQDFAEGLVALSQRRYAEAAATLERVVPPGPSEVAKALAVYSLCRIGARERALALARRELSHADPSAGPALRWLAGRCEVELAELLAREGLTSSGGR
jgi:spermidine synthase